MNTVIFGLIVIVVSVGASLRAVLKAIPRYAAGFVSTEYKMSIGWMRTKFVFAQSLPGLVLGVGLIFGIIPDTWYPAVWVFGGLAMGYNLGAGSMVVKQASLHS